MIVDTLRAVVEVMAIAALIAAADLFLRGHGGWRIMIRAPRRLVNLGRRKFSRAADLGIWLGRHAGCRVYCIAEDLVLVLPPHNGKSSYLVDWVLSQPRAVTGPGTRPDVVTGPGTRPDLPELGEAGGAS
jgi:hypothetical protein